MRKHLAVSIFYVKLVSYQIQLFPDATKLKLVRCITTQSVYLFMDISRHVSVFFTHNYILRI